MIEYDAKNKPIKVFGIPFFEEKKVYERLPEEFYSIITETELCKRTPGARVCFKTNSPKFKVRISLADMRVDIGMSIFACQSACVVVGERTEGFFAGLVNSPNYQTKTFEKEFEKSSDMEDITIYLPRNEQIEEIKIYIEEDAKIEAPTPYKYGPVLFYGSSITEGGCVTKVTNSYGVLLSSWLDFDYYNFGFSSSAKGELEMADYINTIDFECFVYDYDHNAPTPEHLEKTHELFFKRIREKKPNIPVIIMSKPDFDYDEEAPMRREIIKRTYENAVKNGDKNVYFIDGETFFGDEDRHCCTVDRCHPNDLGSYRMATVIKPVIKKAMNII